MSEREAMSPLASLSGPLAVPAAEVLEHQQRQVLPLLRQFVRGMPTRRRRKQLKRRALWGVGGALSTALLVSLWVARPHGATGSAAPAFRLEDGSTIAHAGDGYALSTGHTQGATLRTQHGARVLVATDSSIGNITADEQHEEVQLARGSVRVFVPRLAAGVTFSVTTPDTRVTVHGTVFSVTLLGEGATTQTCVQVTQGLVSVERAGQVSWVKGGEESHCPPGSPSGSLPEPVAIPASPLRAEPPGPVEPNLPSAAKQPKRESRSMRSAASQVGASAVSAEPLDATLMAQNALLAAALQAERAGNYAGARTKLEALVDGYPSSTLRPDAERSLERVKRKLR